MGRLREQGVTFRALDLTAVDAELDRLYRLSVDAFRANFLYTPIAREEFLRQYAAILPHVRPELVLLAEKAGELIGYIFALSQPRPRRIAPRPSPSGSTNSADSREPNC